MNWRHGLVAAFGLLGVSACTGPAEPIWASDIEVARSVYSDDSPPSLTLFTVINNRNGAGAHSALMVNGSQRVIFDPAGTWHHPNLPERNDVHFGMTDPVVDFYVDYHSRITYHTIIQEIEVTPEVAQAAMQAIMSYGAVPKAQCSTSISQIFAQIPDFQGISHTWFPKQLSQSFAQLPGVVTEKVYDNDSHDNSGLIEAPSVTYNQVN